MYIVAIIAIVAMIVFLIFKLKKPKQQNNVSYDAQNDNTVMSPPPRKSAGRIVMCIEDVFKISGRGTVVTGTIQDISIGIGDQLMVLDEDGNILETDIAIKGIEKFHKLVNNAEPGEAVGILLGAEQKTVRKGLILKKQN